MNRVLPILATILIGLFVLLILGVLTLLIVSRRPFPQTEGSLTVPGLQAEVDVYRDEMGIPHIYAANLHDLVFAQGYIHAQDRFWQMEWWRHQSQGRMSEIAGSSTVEFDKFIRTMGWHRIAADTTQYYQTEAPEISTLLEAYSAGVNAYIGDKSPGELSLNYSILQTVNEPWEIEPWTPVDTVAWTVAMSDNLSRDIFSEINRAALIDELGEEAYAELVPAYPYETRPVIAPTDQQVNASLTAVSKLATAVDWERVNTKIIGSPPANYGISPFGTNPFIGSNNWVIGGQHTETGLPLLANDPHLGIQMPAIWYEVGLHAPEVDVVGFSFAGSPGIVIGHNEHIAWGVTNTGADVQDLYIERINPDNRNQYEWLGEWQEMEIIEEVIKVNGGEDILLPVRISRHGPIMSDVIEDTNDVLAVRWVAQDQSRIIQSLILLNQAENYDDFREALRYWDIPSQNIVFADKEGNIAYQMPGLIPIRQNGFGYVPAPGWTGQFEWEGWIPYEELPALFNPELGYIATANHAIVDSDYSYYIKRDWADGDRGQRIEDMINQQLANEGTITSAEIANIQNDSHAKLAESYVPILANLNPGDEQIQAAIDTLRGWDGQETRQSNSAILFERFIVELTPAILADEIGEENADLIRNNIFLHQIARDPASPWWDNINTSERETREQIVLAAFSSGVLWLENNVSGDINSWRWGDVHTATFPSAPLGQSGIGDIEAMVNRGPYPADGSRSLVNANSYSPDNFAAITGHPSLRMIVDMSDFDASQSVIPTGQSGHPGHEHYDDEIELWLNGEYHPMWWSRPVVEENAVDHLILLP